MPTLSGLARASRCATAEKGEIMAVCMTTAMATANRCFCIFKPFSFGTNRERVFNMEPLPVRFDVMGVDAINAPLTPRRLRLLVR